MSGLLRSLISFWHRHDHTKAYKAERKKLLASIPTSTLSPQFRLIMQHLHHSPEGSTLLGHAEREPALSVRIANRDLVGSGHGLVLGGTGTGKTRFVVGMICSLLERFINSPAPSTPRPFVIDPKSEMVDLIRNFVAGQLPSRTQAQVQSFLDRWVVINPFSSEALVPMQILAPEPGVSNEVQAYDVAMAINRLGGADMGVLQDMFVYHLVLLGITTNRTLPQIHTLLSSPEKLTQAASESPHAQVREYFAEGNKLRAASLEGVRARLSRLLRLPSMRLMLGANTCISFREVFRDKILMIDIGSFADGSIDIMHFWCEFLTMKLVRAMFERSPLDASNPVALFVDEWQEGLGSGSDIAEDYERVLALARSRGVSLWLASQSLVGAAKVSPSLPKIVATNTNVQCLFRASPEDARAMGHLLPVTGFRPRSPKAPWEDQPRSPYMTQSEELEVLMREASSLPDRVCYYWNKRSGARAELIHSKEVTVTPPAMLPYDMARKLQHGSMAIPIRDLERQALRTNEVVFVPLNHPQPLTGGTHRPIHVKKP